MDGRNILTDIDGPVFVPFATDNPALLDRIDGVPPRSFSLRDAIVDHIKIPTLLFLAMLPLYLCALLMPPGSGSIEED